MANIVEQLTAQGSGEAAGFLNDLVAQLWPNICVASSKMIKDIVEPMFKTTLPGPLSSLHFTKIDFGDVPIRFSNVKTTRTDADGIKLDMNVDWDGDADIELDADYIPQLGVEKVGLHGRLSVLLCPLTNIIPLIGAAQLAFINPPILKLDFTGAANVADAGAIDQAVRGTILGVINSMFTLPNRYLVTIAADNDYFATYHYPLGIIRITVEKAWGFAEEAKGATKKLFSKLTRAEPDTYAKVAVGAEEEWKTSTKNNTIHPSWNETHDFIVSDFDQCITINVQDQDVGIDDDIGMAVTTVRESLVTGNSQELTLIHKDQKTDGRISISCQYFSFESTNNRFSASDHKGAGKYCGLATILVAGAYGIKGQREQLKPSVVVTWGEGNRFQTAIQSDTPGTDINNPSFNQNFRVPVTRDMMSKPDNFRIILMDGEKEAGAADVPFDEVAKAEGMMLQKKFDVGNGASVRASICLRGVGAAASGQSVLPTRSK